MKKHLVILFALTAINSCKKEPDYRDEFVGTYSGVFYSIFQADTTTSYNTNVEVSMLSYNQLSFYRNNNHLFDAIIAVDGTFDNGYWQPLKPMGYFKQDSLYYTYTSGGGNPIYYYFKGKK